MSERRMSRRQFGNATVASALVGWLPLPWPAAARSLAGPARHRALVSTDIGGTDPDDFQSMVHLLVAADMLDLEGLISSPFGPGRMQDILDVIDHYERDFPSLRTWSAHYPSPEKLRGITKQGATEVASHAGYGNATEGSDWIVACARRDDPRPLHLLVWGGIEDLAQALHDAPDILPKLRVYFIGGPNKKWSVDAYHYIATQHPALWIIEANSTYRGWFVGGNQSGQWDNEAFVSRHIAGRGSLGTFFATQLDGVIKMGDTPSVAWLMHGTPHLPSQPGWGGAFVRAWDRPYRLFHRITRRSDQIEQFGVLELAVPITQLPTSSPTGWLVIENQKLAGFVDEENRMRFRFSPKDAKLYLYSLESNIAELNGRTGAISSIPPDPENVRRPSSRWPNWWTDDPSPVLADGPHQGTRTVNQWREAFLSDFARRMARCAAPASARSNSLHPEAARVAA